MQSMPQAPQQSSELRWWQFKPGQSGNPSGKPKGGTFVQRYERKLASYIEDLGRQPSGIELELLQQAATMATRADDLRRKMSRGKPVSDEDLSRLSNGAARILLRLCGKRERNESSELARLWRQGNAP